MEKGKLEYIEGDITKPQKLKDQAVIIPHVCNNRGGYGKGVALAIAKRWPQAKKDYIEYYYRTFDGKIDTTKVYPEMLGTWTCTEIKNELIYIFNMVAQDGYRSKDNPKPLKYIPLGKCMKEVGKLALHYDAEIHCPKFGSELAGGDWNIIEDMIGHFWIDKGINVIVYEYKK